MKKIVLRPVEGGQKSVELKIGKTIIGRGALLECSDKKVSRNHAVLEVTEDGEVFLTPTHVNPCFYQAQGKGPSKVMKKDKQQLLQSGDSIALLPNSYKYIVEIINSSSTSSISADLKESRPADDGDKDSIAEKPATAVIPSEEARKNGSTEENHHPTATTVAAKTENGDRGSSKEASPEAVSKATPTVRKSAGGGALANKGDDGESKSSTGGTRTLPRWLLDSAAKSATTAASAKAKASSVQKDKKATDESATPKKAGRATGKAPVTKARGRQVKESESEAEDDEPDQKSEDDAEDEEEDESEEEYEPKRKKMPEQAERRSVTGSGANRKGSRSSRQNRGLMQKISLDDFIASDDDQWDNSSDEWKPKKRRKQVDDSGSDWEEENRRTKKVTRYAASDSDSASDWERASRRKKPATRTRNRRKRSSSESGSSEESAPVRRGQRRQPAKRPSCKYGRKCFRKNAQHLKQFSHPKDSDYEGSSGDEDEDDSKDRADGSDAESSSDRGKRPTKRPSATDTSKRRAKHREEESDDEDDDGSGEEDDRPMCRYGKECFRKNAQHLKNFKHPPSTPSKKKEPAKQTSKKAKSRGKAKGSSEEEEASGDEYEWKDDEDDAKKSNEEDSSSEQKKATPAKRKRAAERRAAPTVDDDDD